MSRYTNYQDERFTVVSGHDHILGKFIQVYDKDMEEETPDGEGLILDWSEGFGIGINYLGTPISNNEIEVMTKVGKYLTEHVDNLIIITAEQSFSLN